TALRKIMTERLANPNYEGSILSQMVQEDGLSARTLFAAAGEGDAVALEIVQEAAFALAVGATCMMHTIDPEIILFGGGMSVAGGLHFLSQIRQNIHRMAFAIPAKETRIELAELAEKAGYIGAAGWARHLFE
ncbi:MAG TPA: ROK family protein, partial [Gemmatales bacterium]|nr:ROK family protein [Gemmatales bacterium]